MNTLLHTNTNTIPPPSKEESGILRAMGLTVAAVTALSYPVTSESQTDRSPISKEAQLHTDILDFSGVLDKKSNQRFAHIFGRENLSVDGPSIRVSHPKDSYGPASGSGFLYEIPTHLEKATLLYKVMFQGKEAGDNVDFGKGGKLPGFSWGDAPRGWSEAANGFSARLMWTKSAGLDIYLYIPGKKETYGTHIGGKNSFRFIPGKYYQIQQDLKLNTPGKSDGLIIVSVDGKEIARLTNVLFRERDNIEINSVMFSNFLGGHDKTWASSTAFENHFRDFKIIY